MSDQQYRQSPDVLTPEDYYNDQQQMCMTTPQNQSVASSMGNNFMAGQLPGAEGDDASLLESGLLQTPLAGGIFQDLSYPIAQSFPGPAKGTTSKFDLTFRDTTGFKDPTSLAYLNRQPAPAKGWKGLRLDYGPNPKSGGATNWHWNQDGAGKAFGIADHTLASPAATRFGQVMKVARPLGRAAMVVGAGLDAYSLGSNIYESSQTGDWDNTKIEGSRIAGGWGGAWAGAEALGAGGAALGTMICPGLGTAIGGAIGGIAGGIGGYFGGSKLGEKFGEWWTGD